MRQRVMSWVPARSAAWSLVPRTMKRVVERILRTRRTGGGDRRVTSGGDVRVSRS